MFCKSCGKQIDNDSVYCSYCGIKQSGHYKPIVDSESAAKISVPNSVNVNLSFGRSQEAKKHEGKVKVEKYDLTYEKDSEATAIGIVLILVGSLIYFLAGSNTDIKINAFFIIASLIGRIMITAWCVNIAKRQNRESASWGIFAFFLPTLALIIIGQLKKLRRDDLISKPDEESVSNEPYKNNNDLPFIELPISVPAILDSLRNDNFTLRYFIKEYKRYMIEKGELFPMYAAIELNKRGEKFDMDIINSLNSYSKDQGLNSFKEMLEHHNQKAEPH